MGRKRSASPRWTGRGIIPILAHGCLGHLYLAQGDLEPAIWVLEQGLALCRASGNRNWLREIVAALGAAYALQGRLAEGRALLEEGDQRKYPHGRAAQVMPPGSHGSARSVVWRDTARRPGSTRARRSTWPGSSKARGNEAQALYQLGAVHAHADPPDAAQAEAHYQQALALAEELGMRPLQAHCHRGLGTLYTPDRPAASRPVPRWPQLSSCTAPWR